MANAKTEIAVMLEVVFFSICFFLIIIISSGRYEKIDKSTSRCVLRSGKSGGVAEKANAS